MVQPRTRRALILAGAAATILGLQTAQAAVTGGNPLISATQPDPCATSAVSLDYDVAYSPASAGYAVTAVRVTGLGEGCAGSDLTVTLTGQGGRELVTLTSPVSSSALALAVPEGTVVSASALEGASVVLSR